MTEHDRRQTDAYKKEIMDAFNQAIPGIIASAIEHHQLSCPIRDLIPQVNANTSGVNNFRKFQLDMTTKVAFVHGAAKAWSWIIGLAFTASIGLGVWAFHEVYPAFRAIMVDYYNHHPEAQVQPQKSVSEPGEVYTVRMAPPRQFATKE